MPRIAILDGLLHWVAAAAPFKRRPFSMLWANHPELLESLLGSGIALLEYATEIQRDLVHNPRDEPEDHSEECTK